MRPWIFLAALGCAAGGGNPELVGEQAPDFTLRDADGVAHTLSDQEGEVVVLDFSAMWCLRCQETAPEMEALHQTWRDEGVHVWSILFQDAAGDDPDEADLRAWSDAYGLTHPVLADEAEGVWEDWGRGHQPVIFVVGPDRTIRFTADGPGHREAVDAEIGASVEEVLR